MSTSDFRTFTMDENTKPDSWLNDLSNLIQKKKEENELLRKLRESLDLPATGPANQADTRIEIADDNTN